MNYKDLIKKPNGKPKFEEEMGKMHSHTLCEYKIVNKIWGKKFCSF